MKKSLKTWTEADYVAAAKASPIKVGDFVKVTRTAKTRESGWANSWRSGKGPVDYNMDLSVGRTLKVLRGDNGTGFELSDGLLDFAYPLFVLKKVNRNLGRRTGSNPSRRNGGGRAR